MGNADSTEQGFDKYEQRRPTRQQLDETVYQPTFATPAQNIPPPQKRLSSQGAQQQYLAAYNQPYIQPHQSSNNIPVYQHPLPPVHMQAQQVLPQQPPKFQQQTQFHQQQQHYNGPIPTYKQSNPPIQQVQSTPQVQEWRINMQHPHMLRTLGGQPEGDQIRYYFEFCPVTLQGLLADRVGTKKHFPEDDLQAMLLGIASAISFLQEQGISHGNLIDNEIYFDSNSSSFKVVDSALINGRGAGIIATLQNRQQPNLSPELYLTISQNSPQTVIQHLITVPEELFCKNDVWCLGMIMLQSCLLLQNNNDLYLGNGQFRFDLLQQRIQSVGQIYSNELTHAISVLLQPVESRPDPVTLFAYLASLFHQSQQITTPLSQPQYVQQYQNPQLTQLNAEPQQSHQQYLTQQKPQPQPQQLSSQQQQYYQQTQPSNYQRLVSPPQKSAHQQQIQSLNGPPTLAPNVPIRQVVKQIVFPDGRVEYQVTQPDEQTVARPAQPVPMHQISQQSDYGIPVLGNIENRMQYRDTQEDRIQKVIAQSQALRENFA